MSLILKRIREEQVGELRADFARRDRKGREFGLSWESTVFLMDRSIMHSLSFSFFVSFYFHIIIHALFSLYSLLSSASSIAILLSL